MKSPGRPPCYTPAIADEICTRLAAGESLLTICNSPHLPNRSVVHEWVVKDTDGFADKYARARNDGLDTMADELIDIADDGRNDWMERSDPDNPGYLHNGEHSQRSRLRVDTRKWYLSKLAPKRYGEKQAVELTGADGGPVKFEDAEKAQRIAAILAAAAQRKAEDENSDLL